MAVDITYNGPEKRESIRIDYCKPLAYKVCKQETLSRLCEGYTVNLSEAGLLCNIHDAVNLQDIMWLSFARNVLVVCEEIDRRSLIYQNGVIGKVVRIDSKENGTFDIGVKFLTREEKKPAEVGFIADE
jgi:hypothetical protein